MEIEIESENMVGVQMLALKLYGKFDCDKSIVWLVEELGEFVAAIRKGKDAVDIEEELGDTLAWLFCLANILDVSAAKALERSMSKECHRQQAKYGGLKYWAATSRQTNDD